MDKMLKIGVFDDVSKAERAVADAVAAGVNEDDITMFVSDDEPEPSPEIRAHYVIHPSNDMSRGHVGGGFGAALGGLLGSILMYLTGLQGQPLNFVLGLVIGGLIGASAGAAIARYLPAFTYYFMVLTRSERALSDNPHRNMDHWRSALGGAIGGLLGALAGVLTSSMIGIASWWFFISSGFMAAGICLVVGGLIGAMVTRGLAPSGMGIWEDLVDEGHKVMISVDLSNRRDRESLVEDLLRRDGAMIVRTA